MLLCRGQGKTKVGFEKGTVNKRTVNCVRSFAIIEKIQVQGVEMKTGPGRMAILIALHLLYNVTYRL